MCKILVKHGCHSISEGDVWMATCIFKIITLLGGLSLFLFGIGWFLYCPVFYPESGNDHDKNMITNHFKIHGSSQGLRQNYLPFFWSSNISVSICVCIMEFRLFPPKQLEG